MPKTKPIFVLLIFLLIGLGLRAQEKTPMINGTVDISITKGTIACDLILTDLPAIPNYVIRLNSGMNIHYFKDLDQPKNALDYDYDTKDSVQSDEVKSYIIHKYIGSRDKYTPNKLEVKYLGMYPIADSTSGYMGGDWRGNIAFNGYSVRADGMQSCWYPVIYDKDKNKRHELVRYNIKITCNDCNVLFINGSEPVKAKEVIFKSDIPHEMALFCGSFATAEKNGVWLLNSGMTKADEQKLFLTANNYENYYAKKMAIPFKGSLTFIQTNPVQDPQYCAFSFFVAPTTINVGVGKWGLQSMFTTDNSLRNKKTMAHELAHYYFGTLVKPGSEFGHIIEEGFAEYMALRLSRSIEGDTTYFILLKERMDPLQNLHNYKPFNQVRTENDYGNREYYLYYFAPTIFCAIEKEIGEKAMWQWLRAMAITQNDSSDYIFMVDALKKTVTDDVSQKIIIKYFTSSNALLNAKKELGM